jgi:hypothetical protein
MSRQLYFTPTLLSAVEAAGKLTPRNVASIIGAWMSEKG